MYSTPTYYYCENCYYHIFYMASISSILTTIALGFKRAKISSSFKDGKHLLVAVLVSSKVSCVIYF